MAITIDAAADLSNNGGSTSSLTTSYTCSGSNGLLCVNLLGDVIGAADDISSVTYNGVAMTFVDKNISGYPSGTGPFTRYHYLYQLLGPSTGAHNVVVTAGSSHYLLATAISFNGVGAIDTSVKQWAPNVGDMSLTTPITTGLNNAWVVVCENGYNSDNSSPSTGTGTTFWVAGAAFGQPAFFTNSTNPLTPAGSYNFTTQRVVGNSFSIPISHILLSFGPVVSATGWGPMLSDQRNQLVQGA